jgi:hypothetical protein
MKKGLVVLLILAMTGAAFAQEVKLSGQVEAGLLFQKQDELIDGTDDLLVKPHNDDAGKALRADLNAVVDFGDYGLKIRLRGDDMGDFSSGSQAYLWGNFANDLLTVTAGKFGGAWHTEGNFDSEYDGLPGVRFEIKPIDGLNFGFALDGTAAGAGQVTIEQFLKETVIGAKYSTDLFSVVAALKVDSDVDGGSDEETAILYSFKVTPGAITFVADGEFSNLASDDIKFEAHQNLKFQVSDPFEVHLAVAEVGGLKDTKDTSIALTPGLSYGVSDALTLKADVGYKFSTIEETKAQISVKPGLEYALGDTATIKAWYKLYINPFLKDKDTGIEGPIPNGLAIDPKHEVQIDFIWSF